MSMVTRIKAMSAALTLLLFMVLPVGARASYFVIGDVTGDGKITSADAREILRFSVGIIEPDNEALLRADIDADGSISAADARSALRIAIGFIEEGKKARSGNAEITGKSDKGYLIYKINGATYVDGVLIVNKTYSLPPSFSSDGLTAECSAAFSRMKAAAAREDLNLYISSGYRSYNSQNTIYNRYVKRDGKKLADTYSARPGHSEHQSGLAIDLNTIKQSFINTPEGKWVAAHCHEYGCIIRYPKGKSHITGYCYEPWHIRYVGVDKATEITRSGLCLEEYYGITSQYA